VLDEAEAAAGAVNVQQRRLELAQRVQRRERLNNI